MPIDISNLPGNSNMEKAQKIRDSRQTSDIVPVQKGVVQGSIRKSKAVHLRDVFIMQDIFSVLGNVGTNLVIPRFRQLAYEIVNNVARGVFLGENVEFSVGKPRPTNYNSISTGGKSYTRSSKSTVHTTSSSDGSFHFDTVEFDDYGKAKLVLDALDDMMESAGVVTVGDLYAAAKLSCPFTGWYFGWHDISSVKIKFDGEKYWLKFPPVEQIKDD